MFKKEFVNCAYRSELGDLPIRWHNFLSLIERLSALKGLDRLPLAA